MPFLTKSRFLFFALSTVIDLKQGRKLAAAFLEKEPNWILIGDIMLVGIGLTFWLFTTFGSLDSSVPKGNQPIGPRQQINASV